MKLTCATLMLLSFAAVAVMAQDVASDAPDPAAPEEAPVESADAPPAPVVEDTGPVIPVPFTIARYEPAWSKNPFMRKTVAIAAPQETFAKDWALSGMAEFDGKIRVTLINKQTGERKRITSEDSPEAEFKLVKANFSRKRSDASVEVQKGGETATLKYDENLSSRPITVVNTQLVPGNAQPGQPVQPGQAGQRGQPGQPGQPVQAAPPGAPRAIPGRPTTPQAGVNSGGVGAVVTAPGAAPMQTTMQPMPNTPVPPGAAQPATPPSISRRRQLVPAPVIPPQQ
jgi:hypothetical protein